MIAWDAIKTSKFAQLWIFEQGKKRENLEWYICLTKNDIDKNKTRCMETIVC